MAQFSQCICGGQHVEILRAGDLKYVECVSCNRRSPGCMFLGERSVDVEKKLHDTWNTFISQHFSQCTALVETEQDPEQLDFELGESDASSAPDLNSKLEYLLDRKSKVERAMSSLAARLSKLDRELSTANADLILRISEAERELYAYAAKRESEKPKPPPGYVEDDLDEEFNSTHFSDRPVAEHNYQTVDKKYANLFRKIAAKTHPDKTEDTDLHGLFRQALRYRDDNDFDGLASIYNFLRGRASGILTKLMRRIADETAALLHLETQLSALRESNSFQLLDLYTRNKTVVLESARMQLHEKLRRLQEQLRILRKAEQAPKQGGDFTLVFE